MPQRVGYACQTMSGKPDLHGGSSAYLYQVNIMTIESAGKKFREAVAVEKPLQCVGAINAYHARLAESSGFKSLYISGGGVAAGSCGIPDLGIATMEDVLTDLRRITDVTTLPVLVDVDTGWGGAFNIARAVREMTRGGAAAIPSVIREMT